MATETSTTGRDSDKFMLRFPDGMRERVAEAAKAAGRSMNAEIVQRLEQSFERTHTAHVQAGPTESRVFIELMTTSMQNQVEMLTLRISMAKLRMQSEVDRFESLSREIELETKAAQTDEDFARVEAKVAKLSDNKAVLRELEAELVVIVRERELLLQQLDNSLKLVEKARQLAEARLTT